MMLVSRLHHFQFTLQIFLIHEECLVIFVIIFILLVRHCSIISNLNMLSLCQHTDCRTVDDRF